MILTTYFGPVAALPECLFNIHNRSSIVPQLNHLLVKVHGDVIHQIWHVFVHFKVKLSVSVSCVETKLQHYIVLLTRMDVRGIAALLGQIIITAKYIIINYTIYALNTTYNNDPNIHIIIHMVPVMINETNFGLAYKTHQEIYHKELTARKQVSLVSSSCSKKPVKYCLLFFKTLNKFLPKIWLYKKV